MSDTLLATAVSLSLATITTVLLMLVSPPLAWWLARTRSRARSLVEALVALPLVLPPTVIGFYLLLAMAPDGFLGAGWHAATGQALAFSFSGLVIGSLLYSLPFVVQPLSASFRTVDPGLLEAAAALGADPRRRFLTLILPMHRRALLAAAVLGFAHTVGEFGIVLMIGGNIPGETRVLSIALFDQVEAMRYTDAHVTAGLLVAFAIATLVLVYRLQANPEPRA
jgi:molybdate transport system permease protein